MKLGLQARIRHGDRRLPKTATEVDIVFTTPESLDVMLVQGPSFLNRTTVVIVDEIHQLFGSPRGSQLQLLFQRLEELTKHPIQRIALSATIGNPENLAAWLCPARKPASVFSAPSERIVIPTVRWISNTNDLSDFLKVQQANKILAFVTTRRTADDVFLAIRRSVPYQAFVHYSSLSSSHREYVETRFKKTDRGICVATTTLELGIDIGSIEQVLLYDPPYTVSSFLQRVGRGGRRSDENYVVMTATSDIDLLQFITLTELANKGCVETSVPGKPFSVLAQQILSHVCSKHHHRIHENEILDFCTSLDWIQQKEVTEILNDLVSQNYLRYDSDWNNYQMGPKLSEAYNKGTVYSNIEFARGGFRLYSGGRPLATLPLLGNRVRLGATILYAGRYWRIISVSGNELTVEVTGRVADPVRPMWSSGRFAPHSMTLAIGMRQTLVSPPDIFETYNLDSLCRNHAEMLFQRVPPNANPDVIFYEQQAGRHIYYTFSGIVVNLIVQLVLESEGYHCELYRNSGNIAITSDSPLDFRAFSKDPDMFENYIANTGNALQA